MGRRSSTHGDTWCLEMGRRVYYARVVDDAAETIDAELAAITSAFEQVERTLRRINPRDSFRLATEARELLDKLQARAAQLRAEAAARWRSREALSLAVLGERIGISKARAEALVNQAREGGHRGDE